MANLNLSQFGEKLFVADADHTFIWDTENAISKRVSRNSWLNSGTLTSDAPVTISQTWNGTGSTVFKALVVNATTPGTTSSSSSLLLDLQVGGASKFNVYKDGSVTIGAGLIKDWGSGQLGMGVGGSVLYVSSAAVSCTNQFAIGASFGIPTVFIARDADNTLALRNGALAQTFRVYNTYSNGGIDFERGTITWESNELNIRSEKAGSGQSRNIIINAALGIKFFVNNSTVGFQYTSAGHLLYTSDNSQDIGASGANRPRNVYVGTSIVVGANDGLSGSITVGIGASKGIIFGNRGQIGAVGDGVFGFIDFAGTSFSRLQLGPNNDSAPAIARDGAGIKFTGAAAGSTSWIKVPPVAVSALPAAATAGAGARAFVNDATAPVFGSAVSGGGAVLVPVYSTGSAWNVG